MAPFIKRSLFFVAFLLLLICALYPKPLLLKYVRWKLARQCHMTFDTVRWEEGEIIFEEGLFSCPGELKASFTRAVLEPSLAWRDREIGGELTIEGLRLAHTTRAGHPFPTAGTRPLSLPFFSLNFHTSIERGRIELFDSWQAKEPCQSLMFDLEHQIRAGEMEGEIRLDWGEEIPPLDATFCYGEDEVLHVTTDLQSRPLHHLYALMTHFFYEQLPDPATDWKIREGIVEGKLHLAIRDGAPLCLEGDLHLKKVRGENPILEVIAALDQIEAHLDLDFTAMERVNGEFALTGGRLALAENGEFWQGIWDLSNLHTTIAIEQGIVQTSTLRGYFMGMAGDLLFDWHSPDKLMRMNFFGTSTKMLSLIPDHLQKGFQEAFPNDAFSMEADLRRVGEGLELNGAISIRENGGEEYQIDFGCLFGTGKPRIMPQKFLTHAVDDFLDHVKDQFCLSQKRFGWFRAAQLPIEKFLSPFLLSQASLQGSGRVDVEGSFDERYLVLAYEGKHFHLSASNFSVTAEGVDESAIDDLVAVHYIDLTNWDHVGFLPLKNVTYRHDSFDLLLSSEQAMVRFENQQVHFDQIRAQWGDLSIEGEIKLQIDALDDLFLTIDASKFAGSTRDTQRFLSLFLTSPFLTLPLEGDVKGEGEVVHLTYHFSPKAKLIEGSVNGELTTYYTHPLFSLTDYTTHFTYDHAENRFSLLGGAGALTLPLQKKSYQLTTPEIAFFAFPNFQTEFTASLLEEGEEPIVLEGKIVDEEARRLFSLEGGEKYALTATREGETFTLEHLQIGPWSGEGQGVWTEESFTLERGRLQKHDQMGITLSGIYDFAAGALSGEIDEVSWTFEEEVSPWKPQGELVGSGSFNWKRGEPLEAHAQASFSHLTFGGLSFGDGEDLQCYFSSKSGISIEGLEVETPSHERYKLGCFFYDLMTKKVVFEGFDFSLPPEKLPWIADVASSLFPGKVHPTILDWVEALKQNEPLEGRISLEVYPDNVWVYLTLKDGTYYLSDRKLSLSDFFLIYDPLELNIWTQWECCGELLGVHMQADSMTLSHGKLAISERSLSPDHPAGMDALIASWERHPDEGWCVHDIGGSFHGLDVALRSSERIDFSDTLHLEGRVGINPKTLHPFLPQTLEHVVQKFSIEGSYALEGSFTIPKERFSRTSFEGTLSGSDFSVGGIELSAFSSYLAYTPKQIALSELAVKDWAGRLSLGRATLDEREGKWYVTVDRLTVDELRISRLRAPWTKGQRGEKSFFRSLFIRSFAVQDFSGWLGDWETMVGRGGVDFTNLPRRTLFSNLLLIPTEITARIGLDFTSLIPAQGEVLFTIVDGQVQLQEFRNMYSNGKRSRFYLVGNDPAYIDFRGNMHMQVKMKQYTLLMKIAELFTITIKGTLRKPTYTFTNAFEQSA